MLTIPTLPLLLIISSMLLRDEELIPIPESILNLAGNICSLVRAMPAMQSIVLILAGFGWLNAAQLMRERWRSLKEQTFVEESSRSLGASNVSHYHA